MATTTAIASGGGNTPLESSQKALGIYFDSRVVESLQPHLYFEQFGTVVPVANGNYTSRFFTFNRITTASVTTLSEGTSPSAIAVTVNAVDATPTQYGVSVEMTDLVALTAVFDLVNTTLVEVGKAVARKIDEVIQTTVNAGTNVVYAGGKASRSALASGDLLDAALIVRGVQKMRANAAPEFNGGGYACVIHPAPAYDVMSNTSAGQWIDVNKYARPENIFRGEIGSLGGARLVQSPNVQTFSSTVTVYPTTLIGADAYRISYWLAGKVNTYVYPPEQAVGLSNQLGQKGWVGAKVNMAVARTQEDRLMRLESAATSL
ncbi:MAG: N4-gp56 family major capsid protein [Candidatus Pacearchaeota archaeon]|nr:N4-gp56 family major capsid protein [Candidatus Pacearchaeota archaeon]